MDIAFLLVVVDVRWLRSLVFSGASTTCAQALIALISVILIKEYNLEAEKGALQANRTLIISFVLVADSSRWGTQEFKWQG